MQGTFVSKRKSQGFVGKYIFWCYCMQNQFSVENSTKKKKVTEIDMTYIFDVYTKM
jgi:hypothetical protein